MNTKRHINIEVLSTGGLIVSDVRDAGKSDYAFTSTDDGIRWLRQELVGKPAEPETQEPVGYSEAPTVAPYEGCWVTMRDGRVKGPLRHDATISGNDHPFTYGLWTWGANGKSDIRTDKHSPLDIIAVHPTDPRITPETPSVDGWIEWKGGECPVDPETRVEIELRDGFRTNGGAGEFRWGRNSIGRREEDYDIVRYRVVDDQTQFTRNPSSKGEA